MNTLPTWQAASAVGALLVFGNGTPWEAEIAKAALPAVIAAVVTMVGLIVTPLLNRSIAKRAPKTEMRARAYGDFVKHWMRRRAGADVSEDELDEILSRLFVFANDGVVSKVACLLERPESDECFKAVIAEMRESVKTSDRKAVLGSLERILKRRREGRTAS